MENGGKLEMFLQSEKKSGNFGSVREKSGKVYKKRKNILYMENIKIIVSVHIYLKKLTPHLGKKRQSLVDIGENSIK